jgi:leucyl aminopeptidase
MALAKALLSSKATDAQLLGTALKLGKSDHDWFYRTLARDLSYQQYRYTRTLSKPKSPAALSRFLVLTTNAANAKAAKRALEQGARTGAGINLARELANTPANLCTPDDLAKEARRLARGSDKARCKVLNEKAMAELGMHSLLSVTAGTATPAKLIVLEYNGGKRGDAPHVLVGKGITFDSGGISLKPGAKMDEMKFDMGGAASVLGTMHAIIAYEAAAERRGHHRRGGEHAQRHRDQAR